MTTHLKTLLTGSAAGAAGAAMTLALALGLQSWPIAVPLGLLIGVASGGLAVWLGGRAAAQRAGAALGELLAQHQQGLGSDPSASLIDSGWSAIDEPLARLAQALWQASSAVERLEELDRLARSLWRAADGESSNQNGILGLLGEVRAGVEGLADDGRALDQLAERIAAGALDQSQAVARTATTVESLSGNIDQISHNADAAADAARRARLEARRGLEQVQGLIEGIDRLRAHVESNGRKVRRLGDRSVEIGAIVDLIDGISGRTDMLALNATIESVRAGEHGRGFAVVAEEIRKLAERTAAATREIGTLVEAIQADTHESVEALGQEQAEVEQEASRVREAGEALERIGEVAERSAELVEGISRSANAQVHSTHELVRAMQRISEVTQEALSGTARAREHARLVAHRCQRLGRLSAVPAPVPLPVPGARGPARHAVGNGYGKVEGVGRAGAGASNGHRNGSPGERA